MEQNQAQRCGSSHPIECQMNWDVLLESSLLMMELKWIWRRGPVISLQFWSGKQFVVTFCSLGFDFQFLALCLKSIYVGRYTMDFGQERDILKWIINYLDANKAGLLTHLLGDGGPINISYKNFNWSVNYWVIVNQFVSAPIATEFTRGLLYMYRFWLLNLLIQRGGFEWIWYWNRVYS